MYILDGKEVVPAPDFETWAMWFGTHDRQVALTDIGPISISTIFVGLERDIFETIIFRGGLPAEQSRYDTWEEAEAGHEAYVARVRAEIVASAKEGE